MVCFGLSFNDTWVRFGSVRGCPCYYSICMVLELVMKAGSVKVLCIKMIIKRWLEIVKEKIEEGENEIWS